MKEGEISNWRIERGQTGCKGFNAERCEIRFLMNVEDSDGR